MRPSSIVRMFAHTPIWLFALLIGISFVVSVALGITRNLTRSRNMEGEARSLGFMFTAWIGPESTPKIVTPFLMNGSGAYKNVLRGSYEGLEVQVFDYSHTSGSSSHSTTSAQTVAVYKKNVSLPAFAVGPGGLAAKIIDALEHQNVELNVDQEFSHRYSVRGSDKERVRALFSAGLISFLKGLDQSKSWQIEGSGNALVIYRFARRIKPSEVRDFLQDTYSIAQSFFAYAGTASFQTFSAGNS